MRKIKVLSFLLVITFVLPLLAACGDDGGAPLTGVTINVYNWGQYIATGEDGGIDVNAEFTKRTGIQVNYMTYDSNETMYSKLSTGGSSIDVIIPSDYMIQRLIKEDMLEKLNFDNIPNASKIDPSLDKPPYDPDNEYSVPYTFGTVGIIYNPKYVKGEVDSWDVLFDEAYKGKILMFDNPRDAFAIAELKLGYDVNSESKEEYDKCIELLKQQKPIIQSYVMDQIFDLMTNEEAWVAPYYAGDYLTMLEDNPDLKFAFPKEGFNYFVDAMCIPKGCEHKDEAEAYINFLCDPEIAGENMAVVGYATPVIGAKDYLSEDYANSPVAYPDKETLKNGKIFINLSDDAIEYMNTLWSELKVS